MQFAVASRIAMQSLMQFWITYNGVTELFSSRWAYYRSNAISVLALWTYIFQRERERERGGGYFFI